MALSNYTELQAAALDWMERAGQTGQTADWVKLAEAKLNRKLGAVETDTTLTGTSGSRSISISAVSMVEPIALMLARVGYDEREVQQQANGTFAYQDTTGEPRIWCIDGENIEFDRVLDQAYPFRLVYRQRFALAASSTNWLLTNHPDVYLAATLMWGAGYNSDWQNGSVFKGMLEEAIPEIRHTIAQNKRGTLRVDPAITMVNTRWRYGVVDY